MFFSSGSTCPQASQYAATELAFQADGMLETLIIMFQRVKLTWTYISQLFEHFDVSNAEKIASSYCVSSRKGSNRLEASRLFSSFFLR